MSKHLLIVESPAKAKTIEKFLGKDFKVKSSFGHIRDLEKGNKAVDVHNNFQPKYIISDDKFRVVKELKEWVGKVEEVWLATDEDREGEAISWHLCEVLGLDVRTTKRIVFHEITKTAIQKAIQSPRNVDVNLVDAQQARRVLDRLVGFELSEVLWRKIKGKLSAGRVQSVALKLIVEREKEIQQFKISSYQKVTAHFAAKNHRGEAATLIAELPSRFDAQQDAKAFLEKCKQATFKVGNIAVKPYNRKPAPPFTTSTLQQEASRKLGFSVKRTMIAAQKLYEEGAITYMRTDSTNLSEAALQSIAQEIDNRYGKAYSHTRQYKSKSALAQEAHEAIRPTYIEKDSYAGDNDLRRVYDLIWKRSIASQMTDATLEKTTVDIDISTLPNDKFKAEGEVIKFDGFLKVYIADSDDEDEEKNSQMLPPVALGQVLPLLEMKATERFTRPPSRYAEAALVKKLEELGIGRPSTYAPTISKITEENRSYVTVENLQGETRNFQVLTLKNGNITEKTDSEVTGAAKGRLVPTDIGMIVSDFLDEHFKDIMNYSFTAKIEEQFDKIAEGNQHWEKMMHDFYFPFHSLVEKTSKEADRASGERILGKDPESGRTVLVRLSRLGKPVVQIGSTDELEKDEKPRYANLGQGQNMNELTLEEALKLFDLPKTLGTVDELPVVVSNGRFGPYIRWGEAFISLPKGEDPLGVTLEFAEELIAAKKKADEAVFTYEGEPVTQGTGRFGPYLKWKSTYINIPRKYNPEKLSAADMKELIESKLQKEDNRYIHQWDDLKIAVENGRWGPFIRFKNKPIAIPKRDGQKVTSEMAKAMTVEDFKAIIVAEQPDAFKTPTKAAPKKKK